MKMMSIHLKRHGLMVIVACLATGWFLASPEVASAAEKKSSPAPMQEMKPAGRLVIVRSAKLGPAIVTVKIDGVKMTDLTYNRTYNAPLSAGEHVITVYPVVSMEGARPSETRLNVEPGKTYTFTAVYKDIQIVLK